MRDWWGEYWPPVVLTVAAVAAVISLVFAISYSVHKQDRWRQQCYEQGGHTVRVSRSEICVGSDGRYLGQE